MSLLDLSSDIKPWLGIEAGDTSQDVTLGIINDAMEAAVLNYVETDFQLHVETNEVLDGNNSDTICPRNTPIVSVEKVRLYVSPTGSGEEIADNYYHVTSTAITLSYYKTHGKRGAVGVDYTWGYSELPADVKLCMLQCIEAEYRRKIQKSLGIGGKTKKDESISYKNEVDYWDRKSGLPKVLSSKLEPYATSFEFPVQPMHTRSR